MIGNPVDYDKKYKGEFPKFLSKMDFELKKYLKLIDGKEVLDLGHGEPHYHGVIKYIGKKEN